MPQISIIIPAYNMEKYMDRCLSSIICQTFTDFECIIVDDGSTDATLQVCGRYESLDNRIRVITQSNKGAACARENGIRHAKGNYICFCDSDDYLHFQMLELLHAALMQGGDVACCGFQRVYEADVDCKSPVYELCLRKVTKEEVFDQWHSVEINVLWNKLFTRELAMKLKFPHGLIHEDEFVKPQIFSCTDYMMEIALPLYYYQQRSNSIMRSDFTGKRLDKIEAIYQSIVFFRRNSDALHLEKELEYFCFYYFRYVFQAMFQKKDDCKRKLNKCRECYCKVFPYLMLCKRFSLKYKYMLLLYRLLPGLAERRYGASYRAEK